MSENPWEGLVSRVRVYDHVLTVEEIIEKYREDEMEDRETIQLKILFFLLEQLGGIGGTILIPNKVFIDLEENYERCNVVYSQTPEGIVIKAERVSRKAEEK